MSPLFNYVPVAIYNGLTDGFCYELQFDCADGKFRVEIETFFNTPVAAHNHCVEFCKANGIEKFREDWDFLK